MDDSSKTETKWCMKCHEELKLDSEECRLCGGETFYHFKPEHEAPPEATIAPLIKNYSEKFNKKSKFEKLEKTEITSEDIKELIKAQNRTTHAVRAFVSFLFLQLSFTTFALFVYGIADAFADPYKCQNYGTNCGSNGAIQLIAIIIWITGVIISSRSGWSELEKSEIY
jgi:hypothetical protein